MNIGIIGYGRMGKIIEDIAVTRGHKVVSRIDPMVDEAEYDVIDSRSCEHVDVFIEFTQPDSVISNIKKAIMQDRHLVVGTTGWDDQLSEIQSLIKRAGTGLVYGSNFSPGMNIFMDIVTQACRMMDDFDDYDVGGHEFHHNMKKDSPSGTARQLAQNIVKNIKRKKHICYDTKYSAIQDDELHFTSTRIGSIPGTHSVYFDSEADTIELKHTARGRKGFALGAVLAAEFIHGKSGFYDFREILKAGIRNSRLR